ncbi:MAG TPA: hypothetical protein VFZ54_02970, partial [Burkholderiales bacterium]
MEMLAHLDELTETMKLAAALGGIPLALMLLFPWMRRPTVVPTWKTRVLAAATAIFVLPIAIGSGSCVLGGFIQGSGFCSFKGRDGTWDPVADFYSTQAMYSLVFLLTAFFAVAAVLALLPGRVTAWQRLVFLATAGKRGAWREPAAPALPSDPVAEKALAQLRLLIERETDPAQRAELVAAEAAMRTLRAEKARYVQELQGTERRIDQWGRALIFLTGMAAVLSAVFSLFFLLAFVLGALTQETVFLGGRHPSSLAVSL